MKNPISPGFQFEFQKIRYKSRNYYYRKDSSSESSTASLSSVALSRSASIEKKQRPILKPTKVDRNQNDEYELALLKKKQNKGKVSLFRFTKEKPIKYWAYDKAGKNCLPKKVQKQKSLKKLTISQRRVYDEDIRQLQ